MQIDPRLARLQALIEEKQMSTGAGRRVNGSGNRNMQAYQQVGREDEAPQRFALAPSRSAGETGSPQRSARARNVDPGREGLSQSNTFNNLTMGETNSRQGPEQGHLGRYIDLYA